MTLRIETALDLERFPLHRPESEDHRALVARCRENLARKGLFNLEQFLKPEVAHEIAAACAPRYECEAFRISVWVSTRLLPLVRKK